ncbi:MAG: alpha/beta hydrolase [Gemmatimonadota bacterium]
MNESLPSRPARAGLAPGIRRVIWWVVCCVFASAVLLAAGAIYQWQATRSEMKRQPPPGIMVDIGRYRLHLYCQGTGEPTVILDAGLGDSYLVWSWVQPRIATTNRVCSYDRGGAGYSDPSPRARNSEQISRELHTLLSRSNITRPVVLVGWSAAGLYARAYQSQFPADVAGLVLVDASHEDQWARLPSSARVAVSGYFSKFRLATLRMALGLGRIPGPGGHRLWNSPFDPATDNNLALQMPVPDDKLSYARAVGHRVPWFTTTLREWYDFPASANFVRRLRQPLRIPVAVVSAGIAPDSSFGVEWNRLQADLTTLSSNSRRIIAAGSDHQGMGSKGADSVVAGIRAVLAEIKRQ